MFIWLVYLGSIGEIRNKISTFVFSFLSNVATSKNSKPFSIINDVISSFKSWIFSRENICSVLKNIFILASITSNNSGLRIFFVSSYLIEEIEYNSPSLIIK